MAKKTEPAPSNPKSKLSKLQSLRVLMVEDTEDDALLIIRELKKGGYDPVHERVETAAAMKKALQEKSWDIILCDYKMPKFNAPSAIAILKETNIDIPIIIVSGTIGEETAVECMRSGAQDYIMKNNLFRLCTVIARELEEAKVRSKQRQTESALQESEQKYRNLVERANDGIGIAQDEVLQYANPQLAQMIGLPVEKLTGKPFIDFFTPEEVPKVFDRYKQRMAGKEVLPMYETVLRHKNGNRINVEVKAGIITYQGKPADLVLVRDITERKRTEEIILRSEERFKTLYQESPIPTFTWQKKEADFFLVDFNRAATLLTEDKAGAYIGKSARKLYRKRPEIIDDMLRCFKEKSTISRELVSQDFAPGRILSAYYYYIPPDLIIIHTEDITEHKRIDTEIRASENRLSTIFSIIPDCISITNIETGEIIAANEAVAQWFGHSRDKLIGMTIAGINTWIDPADRDRMLQEVREKGEVMDREFRFRKHTGEIRETLFSAKFVEIGGKKCLLIRVHDITERKHAEEALRESETLYRSQFEDHSAVKLLVDPKTGNIIDANEAAAQFYGWSREKLRQMKIQEINTLPPEDVIKAIETVSTQKRTHFEFRHRRADGSIRDVDVFSSKIKAKGKDILHSIIHDITDRKRAEEALQKSEERMKSIFRVAPIGIGMLINRVFIDVNDRLSEMTGYSREEFVGVSARILYPTQADFDYVGTEKYRQIAEKGTGSVETRWKKRDGKVINILLSSTPIDSSNLSRGVTFTALDITERKQAEEALRESEARYKELVDNISSGVAIYEARNDGNDFVLKDFNKAGERLDGDCRENIIGKSILEFRPGIKKFGLFDVLKRVWETGVPEHFPMTFYQDNKISGWYENYVYKLPLGEIVAVYDNVTERKQAEKAIKESEENFHRSLDDSPLGIRITTAEGETLYANRALLDIYGYDSIEELKETPLKNRYTPESYAEFKIRKEKRVRGEFGQSQYEISIVRKNGEIRHLQILRKEIIWNVARQFQVIYQDITERKQSLQRLRKSLGATINAMAVTVETRDPYTAGHQRRVADLARAIAVEMNLKSEQIDGVRMASMIHDIGKISIPSEILTKPTQLTNLEFNLIKTHSQSGYNIMKDIDFPWPIAQIVLEHHERMNGSGYPNGLQGEQILLESRILAVSDVVEAISSNRPYRPAHGVEVALDEITKNKGILYEPDIVDACLRLFREKNYKLAA